MCVWGVEHCDIGKLDRIKNVWAVIPPAWCTMQFTTNQMNAGIFIRVVLLVTGPTVHGAST